MGVVGDVVVTLVTSESGRWEAEGVDDISNKLQNCVLSSMLSVLPSGGTNPSGDSQGGICCECVGCLSLEDLKAPRGLQRSVLEGSHCILFIVPIPHAPQNVRTHTHATHPAPARGGSQTVCVALNLPHFCTSDVDQRQEGAG